MVIIRLSRGGAKKRPFYKIVAADSRMPRDGRYLEQLGFYNPMASGNEEKLRINQDRVEHWVKQGAQLSDRFSKLLKDNALSAAAEADTAQAA